MNALALYNLTTVPDHHRESSRILICERVQELVNSTSEDNLRNDADILARAEEIWNAAPSSNVYIQSLINGGKIVRDELSVVKEEV